MEVRRKLKENIGLSMAWNLGQRYTGRSEYVKITNGRAIIFIDELADKLLKNFNITIKENKK